MTEPHDRVDARAMLAKWKAARDYWHRERDSHKGSWPSVNASVSAEMYDALSQALADLEAAEYVRQHSRLLFVAKRVLTGALEDSDLRIAVDEHEALVAALAGEKK